VPVFLVGPQLLLIELFKSSHRYRVVIVYLFLLVVPHLLLLCVHCFGSLTVSQVVVSHRPLMGEHGRCDLLRDVASVDGPALVFDNSLI